jgi:hypothetical protein
MDLLPWPQLEKPNSHTQQLMCHQVDMQTKMDLVSGKVEEQMTAICSEISVVKLTVASLDSS